MELDYRQVIESKYNRQNWQLLLRDIFKNRVEFWATPYEISTNSALSKQTLWLGTITLSDDETIAVYEVELSDNVDIERNRRGIRDMLLTEWRNRDAGAFMFCYRKTESVLRFSYVSESWNFAEDGSYQKESTDTKRFTYLLGEGHRSRTAIQQFEILKKSDLKLRDLTKAFSVEAVSKMFFDDYKKNCEDIIQYITGKRMVKVANKWEEKVMHDPCEEIMDEFAHFPNPEKAVRDYVKKLMGRLVFLQFLQKKGWLGVPVGKPWGEGNPEFIQQLFAECSDKEHFVDNVLEELFNDLNTERTNDLVSSAVGHNIRVPYLNGGLFEREATDETEFPLPARYMQQMLDFFASYNFTIDENDPDDAEVGVDPEMLGRIFENLLEDNKDKGAFYTPKEIVTYMCRESLIAYLQTDIEDEETKEAIRQFVTTHEKNDKLPADTDQKLKDVKICDPAIGSGAFPMGLLKELFQCRTALEGIDQSKAAEIKKHIIQNNIYGVDIERGAVDIARLRFWLSLIVDEENPQALPNLDYKIVEGNSLITTFDGQYIDLEKGKGEARFRPSLINIQREKKALQAEQKRFFTLSGEEKYQSEIAIKTHILNTIWYQLDYEKNSWKKSTIEQMGFFGAQEPNGKKKNGTQFVEFTPERQEVLDKCEALQAILNDDNRTFKERASLIIPFFEWSTIFSEIFEEGNKCGYDIVIGNPPYVKEYTKRSAFDGFRETSPYYMGKMDLWYGFACHGIDMLKKGGVLCFIAQNNWTTSAGAKKMRDKVVNDTQILQLVDFNTYMVFEDASIQTMVMIFNKNKERDDYKFDYRILESGSSKNDMVAVLNKQIGKTIYFSPTIKRSIYKGKLLTFSTNNSIFDKISHGKIYLAETEATNGIHTHHDCVSNKIHKIFPDLEVGRSIFVLNDSEKQTLNLNSNEMALIKPYYTSEEIMRYWTDVNNHLWIIYTTSDFKNDKSLDNYPNLKNHLDAVKKAITSDNKPYGLHRAREERFFKGEKIISLRKCVGAPCFSYNDFDCYVPAMYYIIKTSRWNMKFLTGILNSKLIAFWLKNKGKMQGDNYQVDKEPLMGIPLPMISDTLQQPIITIVDRILEEKRKNSHFDISSMESEIDQLVYKLYSLTEEEIKIIEQS